MFTFHNHKDRQTTPATVLVNFLQNRMTDGRCQRSIRSLLRYNTRQLIEKTARYNSPNPLINWGGSGKSRKANAKSSKNKYSTFSFSLPRTIPRHGSAVLVVSINRVVSVAVVVDISRDLKKTLHETINKKSVVIDLFNFYWRSSCAVRGVQVERYWY